MGDSSPAQQTIPHAKYVFVGYFSFSIMLDEIDVQRLYSPKFELSNARQKHKNEIVIVSS